MPTYVRVKPPVIVSGERSTLERRATCICFGEDADGIVTTLRCTSDSRPANPTTHDVDPVAQAKWIAGHLSSTTPSNFQDTFMGFIASDNYFHNTKEAARY